MREAMLLLANNCSRVCFKGWYLAFTSCHGYVRGMELVVSIGHLCLKDEICLYHCVFSKTELWLLAAAMFIERMALIT